MTWKYKIHVILLCPDVLSVFTSQLDFSLWFDRGYWENTSMNIVWYMIMSTIVKTAQVGDLNAHGNPVFELVAFSSAPEGTCTVSQNVPYSLYFGTRFHIVTLSWFPGIFVTSVFAIVFYPWYDIWPIATFYAYDNYVSDSRILMKCHSQHFPPILDDVSVVYLVSSLGLFSLCNYTPYRQISRSLKAVRYSSGVY